MEVRKCHATFGRILVTVGTTEFNELIELLDNADFVETLTALQCKEIVIQYGRGSIPCYLSDSRDMKCRLFRFQPDLHEEMQRSDLIISHCGAGSILEAMNLLKPLIVVVNSSLQGNHQSELSDKLALGGHCLTTTPQYLMDCLKQIISGKIDVQSFMNPFPAADHDLFPTAVDSLFDF